MYEKFEFLTILRDYIVKFLHEALHFSVSGFLGGLEGIKSIVAGQNIKNLKSPTPRSSVLSALILALKDSAEALGSLRSK